MSLNTEISSIIINFILPLIKSEKNTEVIWRIPKKVVVEIAALRDADLITAQTAKQIINILWVENNQRSVLTILKDEKLLEQRSLDINKIVEDNPQAVADYKLGKKAALGHLMGICMKQAGKGADPKAIKIELEKVLSG